MSQSAVIHARIDASTKEATERILNSLGLTPTEAIRLFYRQIAMRGDFPLELRVPNTLTAAMPSASSRTATTSISTTPPSPSQTSPRCWVVSAHSSCYAAAAEVSKAGTRLPKGHAGCASRSCSAAASCLGIPSRPAHELRIKSRSDLHIQQAYARSFQKKPLP